MNKNKKNRQKNSGGKYFSQTFSEGDFNSIKTSNKSSKPSDLENNYTMLDYILPEEVKQVEAISEALHMYYLIDKNDTILDDDGIEESDEKLSDQWLSENGQKSIQEGELDDFVHVDKPESTSEEKDWVVLEQEDSQEKQDDTQEDKPKCQEEEDNSKDQEWENNTRDLEEDQDANDKQSENESNDTTKIDTDVCTQDNEEEQIDTTTKPESSDIDKLTQSAQDEPCDKTATTNDIECEEGEEFIRHTLEFDKFNYYEPLEQNQSIKKLDTAQTLEDCLRFLVRSEHLTDQYFCSNCQASVKAVRRTWFLKAPKNLIINIKRFTQTAYNIKKNSSRVKYPKRLCLDPYMVKHSDIDSENSKHYDQILSDNMEPEDVYDLYAMVCHSGSIHGGHYVCYVSYVTDEGRDWYHISDSHFQQVKETREMNAEAYILFYRKIEF